MVVFVRMVSVGLGSGNVLVFGRKVVVNVFLLMCWVGVVFEC